MTMGMRIPELFMGSTLFRCEFRILGEGECTLLGKAASRQKLQNQIALPDGEYPSVPPVLSP